MWQCIWWKTINLGKLWSDRHALQVLWCENGSPPNAVFVVLGIYIGVIRHTNSGLNKEQGRMTAATAS